EREKGHRELRLALAPVDQLAEDEAHAGEEQDRVEKGGDDPPAPGAAVVDVVRLDDTKGVRERRHQSMSLRPVRCRNTSSRVDRRVRRCSNSTPRRWISSMRASASSV